MAVTAQVLYRSWATVNVAGNRWVNISCLWNQCNLVISLLIQQRSFVMIIDSERKCHRYTATFDDVYNKALLITENRTICSPWWWHILMISFRLFLTEYFHNETFSPSFYKKYHRDSLRELQKAVERLPLGSCFRGISSVSQVFPLLCIKIDGNTAQKCFIFSLV